MHFPGNIEDYNEYIGTQASPAISIYSDAKAICRRYWKIFAGGGSAFIGNSALIAANYSNKTFSQWLGDSVHGDSAFTNAELIIVIEAVAVTALIGTCMIKRWNGEAENSDYEEL